MQSPIIGRVF